MNTAVEAQHARTKCWMAYRLAGVGRTHVPRWGRLRSPGSAALGAATLARICRVGGGYARPDLAAMPLEGDLHQRAGVTVINARSINEALTVAVQTLESGSFPAPGEPTPL